MRHFLHLSLLLFFVHSATSVNAQESFADRFNNPAFYACDSIIYEEYTGGSTWNHSSYIGFDADGNNHFENVRFYDDHGTITTLYKATRNSNDLVNVVEQYSKQGATMELFSAYGFTYAGGRVKTELYQTKDYFTGNLVNSSRDTYTYNGNGNTTGILHELYINDQWELSYRDSFTYDGANRMIASHQDSYDPFSSEWVEATRSTYTYDGQDRLLVHTEQQFNFATSGWDNYKRITHGYGTNSEAIIEARWTNSNWLNSRKDSFFYDSQLREQSTKTYQWQSGAWRIHFRSYCYDAQPPMPPASPTNLQAVLDGPGTAKLTWIDNANNEYGTIIYRTRDTTGIWDIVDTVPANVTTYTEGGLQHDTTFFYALEAYNDAGLSLPSNIDSIYIPAGQAIEESFGPAFRFYPNPANQYIVFEGIKSNSKIKISATDLAGRITHLFVQPNGATSLVDLSLLKPGAYFLKIESGQKVRQEKLLITR